MLNYKVLSLLLLNLTGALRYLGCFQLPAYKQINSTGFPSTVQCLSARRLSGQRHNTFMSVCSCCSVLMRCHSVYVTLLTPSAGSGTPAKTRVDDTIRKRDECEDERRRMYGVQRANELTLTGHLAKHKLCPARNSFS